MDGPSLGRRIRAAQELGGYDSVKKLAEAIDSPGLSAKTLTRIVNDKDPRQARPHELREIARACDVPYEFFTETLTDLISAASHDDEILRAVQETRAWQEDAVERIIAYRTGAFSQILERLDAMNAGVTARIERLESSVGAVIDLAGERTAAEFGSVAEQPARGEAGRAWDGRDRRRRDPGSSGR